MLSRQVGSDGTDGVAVQTVAEVVIAASLSESMTVGRPPTA
jgi:hypothetical protein